MLTLILPKANRFFAALRMPLLKTFLIILAVCFVQNTLLSQAIHFYKLYDGKFPLIRAKYIARHGTGDTMLLWPKNFHITENDSNMDATITVDCSKKPDTPAVAVALIMDKSNTMDSIVKGNQTRWDWLKGAAKNFVDSIRWVNGTQVAAVFFANGNKWSESSGTSGFRKDSTSVKKAIDGVKPFYGGTNYRKAFYGGNPEGFNVFDLLTSVSDTLPRHIVFMTDMAPDSLLPDELADIIKMEARDKKIFIHSVAIGGNDTYPQIEDISRWTGGFQVISIINDFNDLKKRLGNLAKEIQRQDVCEVRWRGLFTCDDSGRDRQVDIDRIVIKTPKNDTSDFWETSYTAPGNSVNSLSISDDNMYFGQPATPDAEHEITLTHIGDEYKFNGVAFNPITDFRVLSYNPPVPYQLKNGGTMKIKIGYLGNPPTVSKKTTLSFLIDNYPCELPTAELISLCGGRTLLDIKFDSLKKDSSTKLTTECAFKNTTSVPIEVTAAIKGANPSDFKILGSSTQIVDPGKCMDFEVEFKPIDTNTRTAYIEYTLPEGCGGTYKTNLSGIGYIVPPPNSVEEQYVGGMQSQSLQLNLEPNPASEEVRINFEVIEFGKTTIEMFNALGSQIESLMDKDLTPGVYEGYYDVSKLPVGVYFMRASSGKAHTTQRLVITR